MSSPTYEKEKAKREKGGIRCSSSDLLFLVREYLTSLYIYGRYDRRNSSEQEGKLFYAERPTCGFQF